MVVYEVDNQGMQSCENLCCIEGGAHDSDLRRRVFAMLEVAGFHLRGGQQGFFYFLFPLKF